MSWKDVLPEATRLEEEAKASKNPIVQSLVEKWGGYGSFVPEDRMSRKLRAHFRLLRAASEFRATGQVPVLEDPFGDKLCQSRSGGRLKIWSIGPDGVDDGGTGEWVRTGKDIVLELLPSQSLHEDADRLLTTIPDDIQATSAAFSRDGKVVAYGVTKGDDHWVVAGDWRSKSYGEVDSPILSADGKIVAFVAGEGGKRHLMANEAILFEYSKEWVGRGQMAISRDGKVIAQILGNPDQNIKKTAIALNGRIQKVHQGTSFCPVLSETGNAFAFALENNGKYSVVVNDAVGPAYDWVSIPALGPNGFVVAYAVRDSDGFALIHGPRKIPLNRNAVRVFLSADGKRIGYVTEVDSETRRQQVVVEEKVGPEFSSIVDPVFSPDGQHVAYYAIGTDDTSYVVIDDKKFRVKGLESLPVFLGHARKVGYGARQGREFWWKIIDVR